MRKLKKLVPRRSEAKPVQVHQSDANSISNQLPVSTQPTFSNSIAASSSPTLDPWLLAYKKLQEREPELLADYKKHLASIQGTTTVSADLSTPRSVQNIVTQQLEVRKSKQWQIGLLGKEVKVREAVEKLVKFSLWADPVVKNAVRAQPYAALAWSGVSLLLPLVASGTIQNVAMLNGFGLMGDIQIYWKICEDTYLQSSYEGNYRGLVEPLAAVYSQVIEYQARVICHLSKAQLSRGWDDVAGANDWNGLAEQVKQSSERCSKLIDPLREGETRNHWKHQLQEMGESRVILHEIRNMLDKNRLQAQEFYEDTAEKALLRDLASDYQGGKNFNPRKVDGTCEWLFVDDRFRKWRDDDTSSLLWITAGPGCGKSVLSRALIDERRLSNKVMTSNICYFFFKDGDERRTNSADAICALLHQLFIQDPSRNLWKKALDRHRSHGKSLTQRFSELWDILIECAASADAGEVICVLDALDECKSNSRKQLIGHLQDFYSCNNPSSKLKFLITSRPEDDLEMSFGRLAGASTYLRFDGDEKSKDVSQDINRVIDHELKDITRGFSDNDRLRISKRLKSTNDRTYLWLYLTLDIIKQNGDRRRVDIERTLDALAGTVADQYERMLNRSTNRVHAESLLRIVLCAKRPLTIDEANVALTLALQTEQFTSHATMTSSLWSRENFISTIKNTCGLLISTHASRLSFIHQTAREFLLHPQKQGNWQGRFNMFDSNSTMYRSCVNFLVLPGIPSPAKDKEPYAPHIVPVVEEDDWLTPFLRYSGDSWLDHRAKQQSHGTCSANESELVTTVTKLCDPESECYRTWFRMPDVKGTNHLGVASRLGLEEVVKQLLDTGKVDVNASDINGYSALTHAAEHGHEAVVKLLLGTGKVDVEMTDCLGRTPLLHAAKYGYEVVVKLLLATGKVDVNIVDAFGKTPLLRALENGHQVIVKLLLDTGKIDINIADDYGTTPLSCAAKSGRETVVKLILDIGNVNMNTRDINGWTALIYAAQSGHEAVVTQLLDTGKVEINAKSSSGATALSLAAEHGHKVIVKQLLDTGNVSEPDASDDHDRTPLSFMASQGNVSIVKQLLDTGKVDVNAKDVHGRTPLSLAAENGCELIIKQLLDTGKVDNLNVIDEDGRTPLSWAAEYGHAAATQRLLGTGRVHVNIVDTVGRTPLSWAVAYGHEAITKQLLDTGKVDVNIMDVRGRTPLVWAVLHGSEALVNQLLDTGKVNEIDTRDIYTRTPLSYAAESGYEAIVKLLLDTGKVDFDAIDEEGNTPFLLAMGRGHTAVAKLLQSAAQRWYISSQRPAPS